MKRALVLSGGGAKGAYQAGAIYGLTAQNYRYDVITGISVGAINGAFLAQYRAGDEHKGSEILREMWSQISNKDVYKKGFAWPLNVPFREAVYDTAPLRELLETWIDPEKVMFSGKELFLGATNINTGDYHVFDFPRLPPDMLIDAVLASSAFPAFLTPVQMYGNDFYFDGGPRSVTPIKSAISSDIDDMHVVICSPETIDPYQGKVNAFRSAIRAVDIMSDEVMDKDLKLLKLYNDLASNNVPGYEDKRYVSNTIIRPRTPVLENPLNFDPETSQEIFERGMQDATRIKGSIP